MINITLSGINTALDAPKTVRELIKSEKLLCGAYVNNVVKSTLYTVKEGDAVEPFFIDTPDGQRIYDNTLLFVLAKAVNDIFPDNDLRVHFSLGGGLYCELSGMKPVCDEAVRLIKNRVGEIAAADLRIEKRKISLKEASEQSDGINKLTNPHFVESSLVEPVTMYEIDGYCGYYYTKMLSHTGVLKYFDVIKYADGLILLGDDMTGCDKVQPFTDQPNLYEALSSYSSWCEKKELSDVSSLNAVIASGRITSLITVAEARHEQIIQQIARDIYDRRDSLRLILIAGPSSSGKTTTSKRLRTHLSAMELETAAIELDNYFIDLAKRPKDENGNIDLESIDNIDIERLNDDLKKLIDCGFAELPVYDFKTGSRSDKTIMLTVKKGSPIILEGIHGLNEKLTAHIPKENKYKLYINDLTHLNIDEFNRIPTTDVRLIRRIVRDMNTRGHSPLKTLSLWESVTAGERQNIYPFSGEADFVFNSSLFYELAVLKKYAEPALREIDASSVYYHEAERLLYMLSFFSPIEDESAIYSNSILREFIGGNVFDKL